MSKITKEERSTINKLPPEEHRKIDECMRAIAGAEVAKARIDKAMRHAEIDGTARYGKVRRVRRPPGVLYGASELIITEDGTTIIRPFPRDD